MTCDLSTGMLNPSLHFSSPTHAVRHAIKYQIAMWCIHGLFDTTFQEISAVPAALVFRIQLPNAYYACIRLQRFAFRTGTSTNRNYGI